MYNYLSSSQRRRTIPFYRYEYTRPCITTSEASNYGMIVSILDHGMKLGMVRKYFYQASHWMPLWMLAEEHSLRAWKVGDCISFQVNKYELNIVQVGLGITTSPCLSILSIRIQSMGVTFKSIKSWHSVLTSISRNTHHRCKWCNQWIILLDGFVDWRSSQSVPACWKACRFYGSLTQTITTVIKTWFCFLLNECYITIVLSYIISMLPIATLEYER